MAVLWVRLEGGEVPWGAAKLGAGERVVLTGQQEQPCRLMLEGEGLGAGAGLLSSDGQEWVLVCRGGREVRVNGMPVVLGMRVLQDRDEVVVRGQQYYFSRERLPVVEVFPGVGRAVFCPRCKQEIRAGVLAVRCPACGLWHHETSELNCWPYAPRCSDWDSSCRSRASLAAWSGACATGSGSL